MTSQEKLRVENMEQIQIALSDLNNRYFAWERLGREPTDRDLVEQYVMYGGAEEYRRLKSAESSL